MELKVNIKKSIIFSLALATCSLTAVPDVWSALIKNIEFKSEANKSLIVITGDSPLVFDKNDSALQQQLILDFKDTSLAPIASHQFDASSFPGMVTLIKPYLVKEKNVARVTIQLKGAVATEVLQKGSTVEVSIPNTALTDATQPALPASGATAADSTSTAQQDGVPSDPLAARSEQPQAAQSNAAVQAPQALQAKDELQQLVEARESHKFSGKPITLQVQNAEISDVLRMIGEASGFNMVIADEVQGKITLSLIDVPWDQVLDVVLKSRQLGAERNHNMLRILTLSSLTKEKQAEVEAKKASEINSPRVTRVIPVSYASPSELVSLLGAYANSGTGAMTGTQVNADQRTNSIIVRDIPENVERMKKLVEILDRQTPQVLIEAKIVEATEAFNHAMGGAFGFGKTGSGDGASQFAASFNGANPIDRLISSGSTFAKSAAEGGAIGMSPTINFIPGVQRINALLNISETESIAKVVSSPKIVVLNKQTATITQGHPVLVPSSTVIPGVGNQVSSTVQTANLTLTATPTVTNDGNLLLKLDMQRGDPESLGGGASGISTRNMNTTVVVESGTTLVMGGIYTMTNSITSTGFPILRKIPVLGLLFGADTEETKRTELFFFVTPRIINEKESGLAG